MPVASISNSVNKLHTKCKTVFQKHERRKIDPKLVALEQHLEPLKQNLNNRLELCLTAHSSSSPCTLRWHSVLLT